MNKPYLSVIVPAYNEAKNFKDGKLDKLYKYLKKQTYDFEILLSDDGSSDDTPKLLDEYAKDKPEIRVLHNKHRGKGPTVSCGMLVANGDNRLFTDFDQSTPISEVEKLLPFRMKKYDIVIGSREVKGSRRDEEPWYRHLMGRGFNFVVQLFTIQGIHDTQCGFKLFSAEATNSLFPRLQVYAGDNELKSAFTGAFDVELLYLGSKAGMRIAEVPVSWAHVETERVNPIKDSVLMFLDILKIRWADMRGKYREIVN